MTEEQLVDAVHERVKGAASRAEINAEVERFFRDHRGSSARTPAPIGAEPDLLMLRAIDVSAQGGEQVEDPGSLWPEFTIIHAKSSWAIKYVPGEGEEPGKHVFINQYVHIGEVLQELNLSTTVEELFSGPACIVCLKVDVRHPVEDEPRLVAFPNVGTVAVAQRDARYVIKPLYRLGNDPIRVLADLRDIPTVQKSEVLL